MQAPAGHQWHDTDVVGAIQVQVLSPGGPSLTGEEPNPGLARAEFSWPGDHCSPIMASHQVGQAQSSVKETVHHGFHPHSIFIYTTFPGKINNLTVFLYLHKRKLQAWLIYTIT